MANVFETFASASLGTALTKVGSHTCGASTTETVIGLTVANRTTSAVKVDITYNNGSSEFYIVIKVKSNTASSVDAVMSMLQIT